MTALTSVLAACFHAPAADADPAPSPEFTRSAEPHSAVSEGMLAACVSIADATVTHRSLHASPAHAEAAGKEHDGLPKDLSEIVGGVAAAVAGVTAAVSVGPVAALALPAAAISAVPLATGGVLAGVFSLGPIAMSGLPAIGSSAGQLVVSGLPAAVSSAESIGVGALPVVASTMVTAAESTPSGTFSTGEHRDEGAAGLIPAFVPVGGLHPVATGPAAAATASSLAATAGEAAAQGVATGTQTGGRLHMHEIAFTKTFDSSTSRL